MMMKEKLILCNPVHYGSLTMRLQELQGNVMKFPKKTTTKSTKPFFLTIFAPEI